MALSKKEFSNFIKTFDFRNMFVEMGWNNDRYTQIFDIDSKKYTLESIAQKSNFKILLCQAEDGKIPDYRTRKNIDNKITAIFYEHLIIFQDSEKSEQIWQFVKKQTGKPNKITETRYHVKQSSSQLLYQRAAGLIFEIDEEENITIVDVNKKVEENFQQNNEKITKQFYDKFKKEHGVFLKFISGIEDDLHKNWYASLMLNRLMFCYFIQKKGFLDNNKNYLRQKLTYCEQFKGKNNFYSFYRSFLLVLFHEGLGSNDKEKHLELIGKIPYLNELLHKDATAIPYQIWLKSHQPFHWFAEFYEIIQNRGGFDVIIGNPPYVEYSEKKAEYKLKGFETEKCGNLYAFVIEKTYSILNKNGVMGMIIPISAFSNLSMEILQKFLKKLPLSYISHYHQRPASLFEGVLQRLSIFISYKENKKTEIFSTNVIRWNSNNRNFLFSNIKYIKSEHNKQNNSLKINTSIENEILNKYQTHKPISTLISKINIANNSVYYRTAGGGYWATILNTPFETDSLSNKKTSFQKEYNSKIISAILNSNLFWWYYTINFDQFNFKDYMIFGFCFNYTSDKILFEKLIKLSDQIEEELLKNATKYIIKSKTRGSNETITYNKYLSKNTMNEIDKVLAVHYGFTAEELDFIINYDIKYRMGKELDQEE